MEGDLLPFLTMVIVEVGYAGMNIISKLAMDFGMNPFVHVAYRQLFATAIIAPLAFFLERQTRPMMTRAIFFQIFLFSIFGLESVGIRKKAGQAKVLGTVVCVGGAMLLSFYQGSIVMGGSSIHWKYANNMGKGNSSSTTNDKKFMLGPFLLIASNFSWGAWLIIQAKIGRNYSAPYTTSALICSMASIESGIIGISVVRDLSAWSVSPIIRVVSTLYVATVCTALAFCLIAWCVKRKGPLYVSMFSPLLLIVVAILSWMLLQEKLYVGTIVGLVLIVMGLYTVIWGKKRETKVMSNGGDEREENPEVKGDQEMQCSELQNGSLQTKRREEVGLQISVA